MTKADYALIAAVAACMALMFAPIRGKPEEVYGIYDDPALAVGSSVEEVQKKEAFFTAGGFAVDYRGENGMWIYKKARLMHLWTSDPILTLIIRDGKIVGKGIRMLEGNHALCSAPADVGEIAPTRPAPDGRACLGG